MNIFFIPSWYPTKESPNTGRFFKDQALLYADECHEDTVVISRWGQGEFIIDLLSPFKALKRLSAYWRSQSSKNRLSANIWELYSPAIEIRPRKYAGDMLCIVKANMRNFEQAQRVYGKMDVIHAHVSFPAGYIAAKLSERFNIPYILTEHMGPFPFPFYLEEGKLVKRVREAFEKANRVVAVSEFLKNEMSAHRIIVDEVIANFIDDDLFVPKNNAVSEPFVWFSLGRITKEKGIDTLIKAFALALEEIPKMVLKIGGTGVEKDEMRLLANTLGVASKIEWLGELDIFGVNTNMQECDAFVCCSTYETFGIVVSEALSCGKSVVSTRCGGPEDMLNDTNGLLVPIGDVAAIAMAMCDMRRNRHIFHSDQIRLNHLQKFGKRVLVAKLRSLYQSVLRDR